MRTAASTRGSRLPLLLLWAALSFSAEQPGFQSLSELFSYEIVVPKWIEEKQQTSEQHFMDKLSFNIKIEEKEYIIHLRRNRDLVSQDFTMNTYDKDGNLKIETPNLQKHCHYQGYVEGIADSIVAVSTCFGLR
ncbi:PREDICTED: disintegrin and metalloproteinase domain-containing protein 9-like [Thamnophis sirtalis]|uniref:Disintegrin and metalloproteinase domain-containing protein 9-like n=1 Tax=Thamnophis sirtalis TaxID=35019 RepID=A0A6I9XZY7_9SAUR|nr:PREDICTED: disintegrin and metalloproteinase domain-containing protein 9-like [Thamnophis sirtalis]